MSFDMSIKRTTANPPLAPRFMRAQVKGMEKTMEIIHRGIVKITPRRSGVLAESIGWDVRQTATAIEGEVYSHNPYNVYVEYGTGIYAENGQGRKTPWVYMDAEGNFHYTHGQHPQSFMRRGFDQNWKRARYYGTKVVMNEMKRMGK